MEESRVSQSLSKSLGDNRLNNHSLVRLEASCRAATDSHHVFIDSPASAPGGFMHDVHLWMVGFNITIRNISTDKLASVPSYHF